MMDFGTDSALAATYKLQHTVAQQAIAQDSCNFLDRFKEAQNKKKLLKLDLKDLVDKGYTPSFLVANGFAWKDLQRRYGASNLLEIGFSWEQMRNCGIDADSACALGMEALHITADQLMEVQPTIQNLASMRLPLKTLKETGFNMHKLMSLGLNYTNMPLFGYSLKLWSTHYDCDWKKLGFTDYKQCEECGWSRRDLHNLSVIPRSKLTKSTQNVAQRKTIDGLEF